MKYKYLMSLPYLRVKFTRLFVGTTKTMLKEEIITMAARQQKFIQGLKAALVRIENKTYGIDRITGKLIPKERLRAVPHATLSVESKMMNNKK